MGNGATLSFTPLFVIPAKAGIQDYLHMLLYIYFYINQPMADFLFQLLVTSKPFF